MPLYPFSPLHAGLLTATLFFLILGYVMIRQHAITGHTISMIMATLTFALFYVYIFSLLLKPDFHWGYSAENPKPLYHALAMSHLIAAAVVIPFILVTLWRALRGDMFRHARLARWTFPLWVYTAASGVLIYWLQRGTGMNPS